MSGMTEVFLKTDEKGVATFNWLPARAEGMPSIVSDSSADYSPDYATWSPAEYLEAAVTVWFHGAESPSLLLSE